MYPCKEYCGSYSVNPSKMASCLSQCVLCALGTCTCTLGDMFLPYLAVTATYTVRHPIVWPHYSSLKAVGLITADIYASYVLYGFVVPTLLDTNHYMSLSYDIVLYSG